MAHRRILLGGVVAVIMLGLVVALSGPDPHAAAPSGHAAAPPKPPRKRPPDRGPLAMKTDLISLEISLGLKDKEQVLWQGAVQLSEGRVAQLELMRGGVKSKIDGANFAVLARRQMKNLLPPMLRATLDAPPGATVTVKTNFGAFSVKLADLPIGAPRSFLDGQAEIERQAAALRLTGPQTEDDFPALAKGPDGTIWLAYVEYLPGEPYVLERILAGDFDALVPAGHGDRVRLVRFDGATWSAPMDVTDGGLDVWRPTVAVDGQGAVVVAWAQQVDGDWEIFTRRYTPPGQGGGPGAWSAVTRLTKAPGADFHVVAATDAGGVVWLAWQAWRDGNFDILLAALADGHPWQAPRRVSASRANDWGPAIAADGKGRVYVAWDTYDRGNYDVLLRTIDPQDKPPAEPVAVANTARFEARPHLVADAAGRVWIAYEEGDEQWGKDYATAQFKRIPLDKNPGFALYINRTVRVKCLVGGRLMQPAGDLQAAFAKTLTRNKSLPRLAVDQAGGLWLLLRHHPLPLGAGEVWHSFALRYDGKRWSAPQRLAQSSHLLDNRPALVPLGDGVLVVGSSDNRQRTQDREQDDLFAAVLHPPGPVQAMALEPDTPTAGPHTPAVHPDEPADVARMRAYRVAAGGKQLRLLRGEFHRHTEYTAHRDQDGTLEDSWRYALDAGALDWMGNGDHDNGIHHEYLWWQIQKATDLYQHPPHFVAVHSYERSNPYPNGHRNVIMPKRGIRPLPRGVLKGTPEQGAPDTKLLYAYLKHFGGICASHTSATNMGTDWRDNDPVVEPIVEIYQGHRHNYEHPQAPRAPTADTHIGGFEPAGFVWNAFEKGHRFGFQASSDHVSTHMSYAVVLTDDVSRQGLIDAFKRRHCYAATDNIILIVRSGEQLMGDAFTTQERPTLEITAHGTAPIAKVHIIRDNKYVYTAEPKNRQVKLRYTDMDAKPGQTSYYYVRIEQADGNLAWASPLWITYKP